MSETDSNNGPPEVSVTLLKTEDLSEDLVPSVDWDDVEHPVDILLLTAKACEKMSCLTYLKPSLYKSYHMNLGRVYFGDMGKMDEAMKLKIAVIQCSAGAAVPGGAIVAVTNAVKMLHPKAVFCVGFCGGLNHEKVKLGDVVISAKLKTYASIKITESGILERGIGVPLNKHLADLIKHANDGWKAPLKDRGQLEVKVHCDGVFLSGPEVLDNQERRADLNKRFPDAIAIEMEAEGLFTAAHDLNVEWVVIKGVSDFADGKKSKTDSWRPFASTMAASLTAHMLSDPIVFRDWPHYEKLSASEQSLTPKRKSSSAAGCTGNATKRHK